MQNKVENQRIEGTSLYIFNKDVKTGDFTYSRPISMDEAKAVASKVDGLNVADNGSLIYMNTLRGIRANRELMAQTQGNVWLPTIQEGFVLHDAKLLPSNELMDFGIALYNVENPDKQIAGKLIECARQKGYAVPILASFKSLDLEQGGERYGVTPVFVSKEGLITGQDAVKLLERFNFRGNSGVCRLGRSYGVWVADWDVSLDADGVCRVGRVSAVGTAKNLIELAENEVRTKYDSNNAVTRKDIVSLESKIATLQSQLTQSEADRQKSVESIKQFLA
ncbi:MAG: hypothetical protein AABW80_02890 [Nanoarchaeota archaeon]